MSPPGTTRSRLSSRFTSPDGGGPRARRCPGVAHRPPVRLCERGCAASVGVLVRRSGKLVPRDGPYPGSWRDQHHTKVPSGGTYAGKGANSWTSVAGNPNSASSRRLAQRGSSVEAAVRSGLARPRATCRSRDSMRRGPLGLEEYDGLGDAAFLDEAVGHATASVNAWSRRWSCRWRRGSARPVVCRSRCPVRPPGRSG
jgi:hypothetical protein